MNQKLKRLGFVALGMVLLASVASAQTDVKAGNRLGNLLIEDSLTPAKAQLRNYVAELRDSLVFVESVQSRLARARAAKSTAVVVSQGRELSAALPDRRLDGRIDHQACRADGNT